MKPLKFLVVDDESDVEDLVRQNLRKKIRDGSLELYFAKDGFEALETLNLHPDIDIVFTDINMPNMDGLTLLAKLKSLENTPTTVVVSAYSDHKNIRTAMNKGAFDFLTKPIDFDDFEATLSKVHQYVTEIRELQTERAEAERRETKLRRFFSPSIARVVAQQSNALDARGERREATFMFTDLRNFTVLVESSPPQELVNTLLAYFDAIVNIVFAHNGTLMQIAGDAVQVTFGAPEDDADHAANAVKCALQIDAFSEAFRNDMQSQGYAMGETRIGINTGEAIIGSFGGEHFFNYAVYGLDVVVAARLEAANKTFGTRLCVAKSTAEQCPEFFGRPIGDLELQGVSTPVSAHELLDASAIEIMDVEAYRKAYDELETDPSAAQAAFAALVSKYPKDVLSLHHLTRLLAGEVGAVVKI